MSDSASYPLSSSPQIIMYYQIVHQIAGRIRIRIPLLAENQEYVEKLQKLVQSLPAIAEVRINPLAQSLVVAYKPKFSTLEAMILALQTAIEQAAPPPEVSDAPPQNVPAQNVPPQNAPPLDAPPESVDRSIDPAPTNPAPISPTSQSSIASTPTPEPLIDPAEVDLQTDPWSSDPAGTSADATATAPVSPSHSSNTASDNSSQDSPDYSSNGSSESSSQSSSQSTARTSPKKSSSQRAPKKQRKRPDK